MRFLDLLDLLVRLPRAEWDNPNFWILLLLMLLQVMVATAALLLILWLLLNL